MTADDTARTDEPTVGWVMRASDADLMLHAQVVWQQLNKRGLTEPRTAEAQEWVDTHLKVVEALETAQAELADREDLMEMAQQEMDRLRGMNKRLRAELAETRDRRDYLQGQLDIIYDAEYSRNDTLARRIERMAAAGDALAVELDGPTGTEPEVRALVQAWRSVRGDTPTDGFETTDTVSVPPKPTQNAAQIWIDGDGWSVAHAVSPPWIRAQQTVCGRGVPSGRDPNPHGRRCRRCEALTGGGDR